METLLTPEVIAAVSAVLIALLGGGLAYLRSKVKESENKLDDAAVDVLDKAIEESKK